MAILIDTVFIDVDDTLLYYLRDYLLFLSQKVGTGQVDTYDVKSWFTDNLRNEYMNSDSFIKRDTIESSVKFLESLDNTKVDIFLISACGNHARYRQKQTLFNNKIYFPLITVENSDEKLEKMLNLCKNQAKTLFIDDKQDTIQHVFSDSEINCELFLNIPAFYTKIQSKYTFG